MYFRSRRKSAGDVSLSDAIDTDGDLGPLSLLDVVSLEEDLDEKLCENELCTQLRRAISATLDEREERIITLRYGLDGRRAAHSKGNRKALQNQPLLCLTHRKACA